MYIILTSIFARLAPQEHELFPSNMQLIENQLSDQDLLYSNLTGNISNISTALTNQSGHPSQQITTNFPSQSGKNLPKNLTQSSTNQHKQITPPPFFLCLAAREFRLVALIFLIHWKVFSPRTG